MSDPEIAATAIVPPERAVNEARLLRLWNRIEALVDRAAGNPAAVAPEDQVLLDPNSERTSRLLARWAELFAPEINLVRLARNSVAHAQRIPGKTVDEAVAAAERLLTLLHERAQTSGR